MISQKYLSYLQVLAQLARFEVPHFHKTVHTPGNQKLAIRGEHGTLCIAVPPLINWHLWAGERGCVGCLPGWLFFVNLMLGPPCVSASAWRTKSTGTLWARTSVGYASSSSFLTGAVPRNKSNAVPGGSWPVVDSSRHVRRWRSGGMHCQRLTLALLPLQCLADERQQPGRGDCGDLCCQRCAQKAAV